MATARVKQQKVDKLTKQRERLAERVERAKAAVAAAQEDQRKLETELGKLDTKIEWQKAEPVDEEDETTEQSAGE